MVGCPIGAKNSLPKNYLWFARRRGAKVQADRQVVALRPIDEGRGGWEVVHERTGAWLRKQRRVTRTRGVVVAGGALGTNRLLAQARADGDLPNLSPRLGDLVRTNSEAVLAVTVPEERAGDLQRRVAITSSIYPDPHTHIETVVYGKEGGAMRSMFSLMTGDGSRVTRPLKLVGQILRHPRRLWEISFARGWAGRTVVVLVMQSLDNAIRLRPRRGPFGVRLQTEQDPDRPNPTFIPVANDFTAWLARRTGGVAGSSLLESTLAIPTTAHILGGAPIGATPADGVVDADQRVFGYENLLVCDGAAVPANVGVNPSLTITAMTERAMAQIPPKPGAPTTVPVGIEPVAAQTATAQPEPLPA
jgi:cholesterol oxidase